MDEDNLERREVSCRKLRWTFGELGVKVVDRHNFYLFQVFPSTTGRRLEGSESFVKLERVIQVWLWLFQIFYLMRFSVLLEEVNDITLKFYCYSFAASIKIVSNIHKFCNTFLLLPPWFCSFGLTRQGNLVHVLAHVFIHSVFPKEMSSYLG